MYNHPPIDISAERNSSCALNWALKLKSVNRLRNYRFDLCGRYIYLFTTRANQEMTIYFTLCTLDFPLTEPTPIYESANSDILKSAAAMACTFPHDVSSRAEQSPVSVAIHLIDVVVAVGGWMGVCRAAMACDAEEGSWRGAYRLWSGRDPSRGSRGGGIDKLIRELIADTRDEMAELGKQKQQQQKPSPVTNARRGNQ